MQARRFPGKSLRGENDINRRSAVKAMAATIVGFSAPARSVGSASPVGDGVVSVKSAYSFDETVERLKTDISGKKIMLFDVIDQAKLASGAGIELSPSTLIVFGNPPLGAQFLTSNPAAGLDWPVRLLVTKMQKDMCSQCTRILPGSPGVTASRIATLSSRWLRASLPQSSPASLQASACISSDSPRAASHKLLEWLGMALSVGNG